MAVYLDLHVAEPPEAEAHRRKAARARRRYLEEECNDRKHLHPEWHDQTPVRRGGHRVREELAAEGFGVLCEIDVQATLREKLGEEIEPYLILGACNPPLAHRALEAEPDLGVLLPCNVVVYKRDGDHPRLSGRPERMLSIVGNDALTPIAADVRERLAAVVERSVT